MSASIPLSRVLAKQGSPDGMATELDLAAAKRDLRKALSALDQAASGPECAQKGHAYATNKGECCIYADVTGREQSAELGKDQ